MNASLTWFLERKGKWSLMNIYSANVLHPVCSAFLKQLYWGFREGLSSLVVLDTIPIGSLIAIAHAVSANYKAWSFVKVQNQVYRYFLEVGSKHPLAAAGGICVGCQLQADKNWPLLHSGAILYKLITCKKVYIECKRFAEVQNQDN